MMTRPMMISSCHHNWQSRTSLYKTTECSSVLLRTITMRSATTWHLPVLVSIIWSLVHLVYAAIHELLLLTMLPMLPWRWKLELKHLSITSCSTVVLYMEVRDFCPKLSLQNQLNIYFVTSRQYRLGIASLKNVFRSFLTHSKKLLWNFKNFLFSQIFYWLHDWLTDSLTPLLMHLDKRNSITAKAIGSISSLFNVSSSGDVPFRQPLQLQCYYHGSTKAHLCTPSLSPLPRRWQLAVHALWLRCET